MLPDLGVGLSYRNEFAVGLGEHGHEFGHLELLTDHYIDMPPHKEKEARELSERFPLVLHGVDMSLGTDSHLDEEYLNKIERVVAWTHPLFVSDHLAFTKVPGIDIGQLTPLPFTRRFAEIAAENIRTVSRHFPSPFLIENISYYFQTAPAEMTEAEFLTSVVRAADCFLLLDLTNVDNNAVNNAYDPFEFIDLLPLERVLQIHLAGGEHFEDVLLDTHGQPVPARVFKLLEYAVPRLANLKAITIERDQNFPPIDEILTDVRRAKQVVRYAGRPD
jgi:uncharacterized protein (UPF0276 family)